MSDPRHLMDRRQGLSGSSTALIADHERSYSPAFLMHYEPEVTLKVLSNHRKASIPPPGRELTYVMRELGHTLGGPRTPRPEVMQCEARTQKPSRFADERTMTTSAVAFEKGVPGASASVASR